MEHLGPSKTCRNTNLKTYIKPKCFISILPGEILEKIIFQSTGSDGCSARKLAQVCRYWYNTTIHLPTVWSYIEINSPRQNWIGGSYYDRSDPKHEICTSLTEWKQTIDRTRKAPLKIYISCSLWASDDFAIPSRVQFFQSIFSAVVTPRIAVLHIDVNGLLAPEGTIDWSNCNFASLSKVACDGTFPSARSFLRMVDKTAVKLEVATFSCSAPEIALDNIWPRLKRLEYHSVGNVSVDSVIPQCHRLEFLASPGTNWPTSATPVTKYPHMNRMALRCFNLAYLTKLQLPMLKTLYITHDTSQGASDLATISVHLSRINIVLPELEFLSLSASVAWLVAFRMPKLKQLFLYTISPTDESDNDSLLFLSMKASLLSASLFPSVQTLKISTRASDNSIIKILPLFPNASVVSVASRHQQTSQQFGQEIVQTLTSTSNKESILLPNLKTFNWGNFSARLDLTKEDVEGVLQRLFEERVRRKLPLKVVTAYIAHNPKGLFGKELTFTRDSFLGPSS